MTRKELHTIAAKKSGYEIWEVRLILDSIIETIKDHIRVGEVIKIEGLGTFELREQKPTRRRDVNTGELFDVPAKKKIVFTPSPLIDVNKAAPILADEKKTV